MALVNLFSMQNLSFPTSLLDWRVLVLASIPLSLIYYYYAGKKSDAIDIRRYSHLPQPAVSDPLRGHWGWLEKIAVEGDVRRAFGTLSSVWTWRLFQRDIITNSD